ncbi:MAG: peptide chain release factor N(5)-glutamine methyltransferase [Candidatus Saganbacteria bacterium]|nr:peptide chain release factor N(5)-glutamine methyltransferase [Candidatus Saganbacteria bacterium]
MEIWTIQKLLDWTTEYFKKHNITWPHLEAEILLAFCLQLKRIELYTDHDRILGKTELDNFKALIKRRVNREPIAYITGSQPFMSLDFHVDRSVLIPRPETELLAELVIEKIKETLNQRSPAPTLLIADVGTGSGCIAVSLAKYLPAVKVFGLDNSDQAIVIAHKNAVRHNVEQRCQFKVGDMLAPLQEKVDVIVSNPPYIPSDQIEKLAEDVRIWEPRQALDGGNDGLVRIKELLVSAPKHLNEAGEIFIEIGYDQGEAVKKLAAKNPAYKDIRIIKDLNKKDRILRASLA